jgi:hypothetical protein
MASTQASEEGLIDKLASAAKADTSFPKRMFSKLS